MEKINNRQYNCQIRKSEDVEKTRTIEFVASDESRDSYGTVLSAAGWDLDRFNRNGIIGYQHDIYSSYSDIDNIIGKGEARIEGKELIVKVTFEPANINEKAEKVFQKLLFGSLNAVSVGFYEKGKGSYGEGDEARGAANETYYYAGQELLEVSIVNIPANANALKRSEDEIFDYAKFIRRIVAQFESAADDVERVANISAPENPSTVTDTTAIPKPNEIKTEGKTAENQPDKEDILTIAGGVLALNN